MMVQPAVAIAYSFKGLGKEVFEFVDSHNDRDDLKIISDTLYQAKFYHHQLNIHTAARLFPCFFFFQ